MRHVLDSLFSVSAISSLAGDWGLGTGDWGLGKKQGDWGQGAGSRGRQEE
ncbi:MAG: hypothetical protein V7L11_06905 [Nostoc sp.]